MAGLDRLVWSPEAATDLDSLFDHYLIAVNEQTAEKILREIARACRLIQEYPLSGRARDEVRPGLRSFVAHPNVIFYRMRQDVVEIVRVLDGRRDIDSIFDQP